MKQKVLTMLEKEYPFEEISLYWRTPWELLVATILSAQCTDERVNKVTKSLFKKYPKIKAYTTVRLSVLAQDIRSTGFYKNKAKNIQNAAKMVMNYFGGEVPASMDELVRLPGVARKTANVVLNNAFKQNSGIVVDTHVIRLTNRLGLSKQKDPIKIEQDLMKLVPKRKWRFIGHQIIMHGRRVCNARKPKCDECLLSKQCPSAFKVKK